MPFGFGTKDMGSDFALDGVMTIRDAVFEDFDYNGTVSPPVTVLALYLTKEDGFELQYPQTYAVGSARHTADGRSLNATLSPSSHCGILMSAFEAAGFPPEILERGNLTDFIGLVAEWESKDFERTIRGVTRSRSLTLPVHIISMPQQAPTAPQAPAMPQAPTPPVNLMGEPQAQPAMPVMSTGITRDTLQDLLLRQTDEPFGVAAILTSGVAAGVDAMELAGYLQSDIFALDLALCGYVNEDGRIRALTEDEARQ